MTPTIWVTPNKNSQAVCEAVFMGTAFPVRPVMEAPVPPGPSVIYGVLRGCSEIMARCEMIGQPFWHIDHGYFHRSPQNTQSGYYRITKNSTTSAMPIGDTDSARWQALELDVADWRGDGDYVLVCPATLPIAAHYREPPMGWVGRVERIIHDFGFKAKRRLKTATTTLEDDLRVAHAVVTFNSNVAIDAALQGIPAWQEIGPLHTGALWEFFSDSAFSHPPRMRIFHHLANQQFTLGEIRAGVANEIFGAEPKLKVTR